MPVETTTRPSRRPRRRLPLAWRRSLLALLLTALAAGGLDALTLPDEDLRYVVMYKWGLINRDAGEATLSLRGDSVRSRAQLSAQTVPWADKVFRVRDTLQVDFRTADCRPEVYRKITHEGERYGRDVVAYAYPDGGTEVVGSVTRQRRKGDAPPTSSDTTLRAAAPTLDMLSVFYYLRQLDYASLHPGQQIRANLFSGACVEQLTLTYKGVKREKIRGKARDAHLLEFSFTRHGRSSGAAMYTWISTDARRVPLKLEGRLPLGKVQAFYLGD